MEDSEILRVQARIERVTLTLNRAELVLVADLDDDMLVIAQAVGLPCAIALQLARRPAG